MLPSNERDTDRDKTNNVLLSPLLPKAKSKAETYIQIICTPDKKRLCLKTVVSGPRCTLIPSLPHISDEMFMGFAYESHMGLVYGSANGLCICIPIWALHGSHMGLTWVPYGPYMGL